MLNSHSKYDFENAPCGYLVFTPEGTILEMNQTLVRWVGYPKEEILHNKKLYDLTPKGTGLYFEMFVFPTLRMQGFINEVSLNILGMDHAVTNCLFNASVVKNVDGSIKYLHAILFSIPGRKKYEFELLQNKKAAENIVEHKEQILQAQRRIMSILGHDTRAPLFSISQMLKLGLDGTIRPDEVLPYFDLMANQLDATLILINNLLTWSAANFEEKTSESAAPVNLFALIIEVYELLQSNANSKHLSLSIDIDRELYVSTHASILSFIIRNLVNNAIKFTHVGGITVSTTERGDCISINVMDTGIGMHKQMIFEFIHGKLQSSPGTKSEAGSGLGVMLIKEFLAQLNAEMEVESLVGKGTTIRVLMPKSFFSRKHEDA